MDSLVGVRGLLTVDDRDRRAVGDESVDNRAPDTVGTARDKRDAAGQ